MRPEPRLDPDELWLLSFYRVSEIGGSLFFGRLAKSMKPGSVQRDMTKHYADEALHAWYWTSCIERLGAAPLKLGETYQEQYLAAVGLPANLMEVLAITQVFEKRVIGQYALHGQVPGLNPAVKETLDRIGQDEKWHIRWVRDALEAMEPEYGRELIESTLERFSAADRDVYARTLDEHADRLQHIIRLREERGIR